MSRQRYGSLGGRSWRGFWLVLSFGLGLVHAQAAQVLLSEFMAASPSRAVVREASGASRLGNGPAWWDLDFDARAWALGRAPLGFGYAGLQTNLREAMIMQVPSLYLRGEFDLDDAQLAEGVELVLRYADGVAVYVNGQEVLRRNLGPPHMYIYADQLAFNANRPATAEIDRLARTNAPLRLGRNVIALQVHNEFLEDGLFLADPRLRRPGDQTWLLGTNDLWRYFIGRIEPSGGVFDPETLNPRAGENEFSDWVELRNVGATPVSLEGWSLTDEVSLPRKWVFPAVTLEGNGYLLVLCDGLDRVGGYLHTNFRLGQDGEYLGLYDDAGQVVSDFAPSYPHQIPYYSYGRENFSGRDGYLSAPTPGSANVGLVLWGQAAPPQFSPQPGFFGQSVTVELTCPTPGATMRYTLDGTEPTESAGMDYQGQLVFVSNTVLRVRAFRPGWIPSRTSTGTYLIKVPAPLLSLPAAVLSGDGSTTFYKPEGVTAIAGGQYVDEQWRAVSTADYDMAMQDGAPVERPVSLELVYPEGYVQADCGLRLAASPFSRPRMIMSNLENSIWTAGWQNKPSFSLFFREEWGRGQLDWPVFPGAAVDTFDSLRLRAGKNDWGNPFIVDEVVRRWFGGMGHVTSQGILCNLFINARYKSYFNLVERYREPFFQSWYHSEKSWDVRFGDNVDEGDAVQWETDYGFVRTNDLADPGSYAEAGRRFDLVNLADYAVLNAYCATWDWPGNNFCLARERSTNGCWRFYVWDAEGAIGYKPITYQSFAEDLMGELPYSTNAADTIPVLFGSCYRNPEFRLLVADRIQRHFFGDGQLTYSNAWAVYDALRVQLDPVMQYLLGQSVHVGYIQNWMTNRPPVVLAEARQLGMWPETAAPRVRRIGGGMGVGYVVEITHTNVGGAIYVTTEGTDPRAPGGAIAGRPYTAPLELMTAATVKARVLRGGVWSPLAEARFDYPKPSTLAVTEIHYDPPGAGTTPGSSFEFLEIQNIGALSVDLTGVSLTEGAHFDFAAGTVLAPGQFAVLVSDAAAFQSRYPGVAVAGVYTGKLDNSGERVSLSWYQTNEIFSVRYRSELPWPLGAAGAGFSLVPAEGQPGVSPDAAAYWRQSAALGGSPGAADVAPVIAPVVINEVLARPASTTPGWRIEFFNPTKDRVNLEGWYLSDDEAFPFKYRLPSFTIRSRGFGVLTEAALAALPESTRPRVLPGGGHLVLLSAAAPFQLTGYAQRVDYGAALVGDAIGRHLNSEELVDYVAQVGDTLGTSNGTPRVGPLILTEIMYDPAPGDVEFIELCNHSNTPLPLFNSGNSNVTWRVNGLDFSFPPGTTLAPMELVLLTGDAPNRFRVQHDVPENVRIFGPWEGQLRHDGELLQILRPETMDGGLLGWISVDQVAYQDQAPWPQPAAGGGTSLARRIFSSYGNEPTNWVAATASPGRLSAIDGVPNPSVYLVSSHGDLTRANTKVTLTAVPMNLSATNGMRFVMDGVVVATNTAAPYKWSWNAQPGEHSFRAMASTPGGTVNSAELRMQVLTAETASVPLVSSNALWRYLDAGRVPAGEWRSEAYDDEAWVEGLAPLGYGEGFAGTTILASDDPGVRTTYFRRVFLVSGSVAYRNAMFRCTCDDGAVIYLNGEEIARLNLPKGTLSPATPAAEKLDEPVWTRDIESWRLQPGTNILAVELHQVGTNDERGAFALELRAERTGVEPVIVEQPQDVAVEVGFDGELQVAALGQPLFYHWYRDTGENLWGDGSLLLPAVEPGDAGGYRVVISNSVGVVTSRVATVTVTQQDSDGDGIPDWWEGWRGLDPGSAADAQLDGDMDGSTNLEEFEEGTDPAHSDLILDVRPVVLNGAVTALDLRFTARAGLGYEVTFSLGLPAGQWEPVAEVEPAPTAHVVRTRVELESTGGFYRLRAWRP